MSFSSSISAVFLAFALLIAAPASAQYSREPEGVFIGAGVSAGSARIAAPGEQTTVGLAVRGRAGAMVDPLLGIDLEGSLNIGSQRNLLVFALTTGVSYFVLDGVYARGEVGLMHLSKAITNGREDTGPVMGASLGYRFLFHQTQTISLDARLQYGMMEHENVTVVGLGIGTTWF